MNNQELNKKIKKTREEIIKLDSQLTKGFIRIENQLREELINKLKDKMLELESSLQEFNEQDFDPR